MKNKFLTIRIDEDLYIKFKAIVNNNLQNGAAVIRDLLKGWIDKNTLIQVIDVDRKELAQKLKAEANRAETIKTSDTPQPLKPTEKAKALLRKTDSKYINHVSKKLLPGLD